MVRPWSLLLAVGLLLLSCSAALADGKVFSRGVAAPPPIPDQQAIIAWDEAAGVETLAIETRFEAPRPAGSPPEGTAEYAWVIPLPGPGTPTITAATPGLFPTVRAVFQPRVDDRRSPASIPLTIAVSVMLLAYIWLRALGQDRLGVAVVMVLAFMAVCVLLLPTLGSARGLRDGPTTVRVLQREIIGSYESTVIGASAEKHAGAVLAEWLREHGFSAPAAAEPVLADYAKRGWVFAAIKLRPDAASPGAMLTPHPLVFRFKTAKAVYPMALTGVGNAPLALDLYVFGPKRATAAGLRVVRCDEVRATSREYPLTFVPESCVAVAHAGLKKVVGAGAIATKLTGTLSPQQQSRDIEIGWDSFARIGSHAFSARGARNRAIEWAVGTVPIVMVALILVAMRRSRGPKWALRRLWWAPVLGAAVGFVAYAMTPTVPVQSVGARGTWRNFYGVVRDLPQELLMVNWLSRSMPSEDEVRKAVEAIAKERRFETHQEDSPGNYLIERGENPASITFVGFDAVGAAHRTLIWEEWEK